MTVSLGQSRGHDSVITLPIQELTSLETRPWEYGRKLGESLLGNSDVFRYLTYALGRQPDLVSLHIEIDANESSANALLWERMIATYAGSEVVFAASTNFSVVRTVPKSLDDEREASNGPFRLLLAIASPSELENTDQKSSDLTPIQFEKEIENLDQAWRKPMQTGLMRVTILARISDSLREGLARRGYTVLQKPATMQAISDQVSSLDGLHIICHGNLKQPKKDSSRDGTAAAAEAQLLLENSRGGIALASEKDVVAKIADPRLRLVFLQSCKSAARLPGVANHISGLAPKIAEKVPAVVGMQDFVGIEDAQRFAQEFYESLLDCGYAEMAVNSARRVLYSPNSASWGIPALYLAPTGKPLWCPDRILAGVQALAAWMRKEHPELKHPFPIEVIRYAADIPANLETSPAGPRVTLLHAVLAAVAPGPDRKRVVVIAGNHGRAKTTQLYRTYVECADTVRKGGSLPFFLRVAKLDADDLSAERSVARAVVATYKEEAGIELDEDDVVTRLKGDCVLVVDGDQEVDDRRRNWAFDTLFRITSENPHVSAVVTADHSMFQETPSLADAIKSPRPDTAILLIQLLTATSLGQFLRALPGGKGESLLASIQKLNLFDIASVPWLLNNLLSQANRGDSTMSRTGVIRRVVESNLSKIAWPPGTRHLVPEFLRRMAWVLQKERISSLAPDRLYRLLNEVRGSHDVPMEQLRTTAMASRMVCPGDKEGVRFAYPGFQSFWCARHLEGMGERACRELDDITATLARRSRARWWNDVLVLFAGITSKPDELARSIIADADPGFGEHVFLAATCIHEARLNGRNVAGDLVSQVVDSLIWRSTSAKEMNGRARMSAVESLGMLADSRSVPHLVSLVVEPVRQTRSGVATFELSGLRQAGVHALLSMQDSVKEYVQSAARSGAGSGRFQELEMLIQKWMAQDSAGLQATFQESRDDGIPAVAAFALGALGGSGNVQFLKKQILVPAAKIDTRWAIADCLLAFDAQEVEANVLNDLMSCSHLRPVCAYMIGQLRSAAPGSAQVKFLESCLGTGSALTKGLALRALAELGDTRFLPDCECAATGDWEQLAKNGRIVLSEKNGSRASASELETVRYYALESLRHIGNLESLNKLRASQVRADRWAASPQRDLRQLSYSVSEDIFWRVTGGLG